MTLEKDIEDAVVVWAKRRNFLTPKVRFADNGYPDRLFISPRGHTIFIEFKKLGEVVDPKGLQNFRLTQLRARGIPAYWTDNYVGAIRILQAALEPEAVPEEGSETPVESSVRRIISGSRAGKNVSYLGSHKDLEGKEPHPSGTGDCSSSGGESDVAGGD